MASRLTTITCNQEIAGSTPAVVITFLGCLSSQATYAAVI
jgi:hypothetical protein